jgi:hypothetical protein
MTTKLQLTVNGNPIQADSFVYAFVDHAAEGMIASLKETGKLKTLVMTIDGDKVVIVLNGQPVTIKPFVQKIFRSTMSGMVEPLKGVTGNMKTLMLNIER